MLLDKIREVRGRGTLFAFDSNYRPAIWESRETAQRSVAQAWQLADIALPSLDDELALFGDGSEKDVLTRLRRHDCRKGALKRGAIGPVAVDSDVGPMESFRPSDNVVDRTAAGDSFNGT
jgi:2-dehydro-3-deoxygluconokinase